MECPKCGYKFDKKKYCQEHGEGIEEKSEGWSMGDIDAVFYVTAFFTILGSGLPYTHRAWVGPAAGLLVGLAVYFFHVRGKEDDKMNPVFFIVFSFSLIAMFLLFLFTGFRFPW